MRASVNKLAVVQIATPVVVILLSVIMTLWATSLKGVIARDYLEEIAYVKSEVLQAVEQRYYLREDGRVVESRIDNITKKLDSIERKQDQIINMLTELRGEK